MPTFVGHAAAPERDGEVVVWFPALGGATLVLPLHIARVNRSDELIVIHRAQNARHKLACGRPTIRPTAEHRADK